MSEQQLMVSYLLAPLTKFCACLLDSEFRIELWEKRFASELEQEPMEVTREQLMEDGELENLIAITKKFLSAMGLEFVAGELNVVADDFSVLCKWLSAMTDASREALPGWEKMGLQREVLEDRFGMFFDAMVTHAQEQQGSQSV